MTERHCEAGPIEERALESLHSVAAKAYDDASIQMVLEGNRRILAVMLKRYRHYQKRIGEIITIYEACSPTDEVYNTIGRLAWNAVDAKNNHLTAEDAALLVEIETLLDGAGE